MLQKMSSGKQNEKLKRRATKMLGKKRKDKEKVWEKEDGGHEEENMSEAPEW